MVTMASRVRDDSCLKFGFYSICNFAGKFLRFFYDAVFAALLTVLFKFVPMMLRILARWKGTTQQTRIELSIMDWDFVFKIIVRASHVILNKRFPHV